VVPDCIRHRVHAVYQHFDEVEIPMSQLVPIEKRPDVKLVSAGIKRNTDGPPNVARVGRKILVDQALDIQRLYLDEHRDSCAGVIEIFYSFRMPQRK
jgi:hypothetical protein